LKDRDLPEIRSTANATIRRLMRLRDNRFRRRSKLVLVDGWRETSRALESGLKPKGIYTSRAAVEACRRPEEDPSRQPLEQVIRAARHAGVLRWVSEAVLARIGFGQATRGVVAEFPQPSRSLMQLTLPAAPLILVLDQLEKPGNLGAVFRCGDAAGVDAILVTGREPDLFNPNAIRSSLGTVFTMPSAVGTAQAAEEFLRGAGIRVLAARVESAASLWCCDLTGPLAVVLGSESAGLGDRWQSVGGLPVEGVRIPMSGTVDSLNVSATAAVIAFEAIRMRRRDATDRETGPTGGPAV
jgi:TrmH family RNA methyltransferase